MANAEYKLGAFEKKWLTFEVIALAQFQIDKNKSLLTPTFSIEPYFKKGDMELILLSPSPFIYIY